VCDRFRNTKVFWVTYRVIFLGFSLQLVPWDKDNILLWQLPTQPDTLFPCTIGDGGLGEPIMSSIAHFHTTYPNVTNFLPVLVWNGYSRTSWCPLRQMSRCWRTGWQQFEVVLVNAKDFDDRDQPGDYVDSTAFSFERHWPETVL